MKIAGSILLSFLATGCGGALLPETEGTDTGHVIGHLQLRDRRLTMSANNGETRFTVRGSDGRVVAADLTLAELRSRHPDLFEVYSTSLTLYAGD